MISTTDDECRVGRDAFVRPFILISDRSPARAVRRRAIAPLRPPVRRGHIHTYSNHTNPIYIHRPPPKKTNYSKKHPPSTHTSIAHAPPRGERVLDRWASSTSHDSIDRSTARARDSTRRRDSTTRDHGAARRVERRLRGGPTPGIGGEIARVTEQVRLERSRRSRVARARRHHACRASPEWSARLTVCLPLDARARIGWIECDG